MAAAAMVMEARRACDPFCQLPGRGESMNAPLAFRVVVAKTKRMVNFAGRDLHVLDLYKSMRTRRKTARDII